MFRPDRRGSFANTAVWTGALLAIAALTVWNFEIWPIHWVATETGTLENAAVTSDPFPAHPIEIAGPGSEESTVVQPTAATADRDPPPRELVALNIASQLPVATERTPPQRPLEPGKLPHNDDLRPLPPAQPTSLPTGSDFAATGLFPEASTVPAPRQNAEPAPEAAPSPEEPPSSAIPADGYDGAAANGAAATIVPTSAQHEAAPIDRPSATTPPASAGADPRLVEIDENLAANRYLAAHKLLSKLYWDEPTLRPLIQSRIDTTARSIYFDPQPHYMSPYEVQPGDQFRVFAKQYEVPWEYLARLNRIDDPSRVRPGQQLKVIKGPFSAVVELSDYTLTVHAHGYYVRRYPVGIGKDGTTPIGTFRVILKEMDPKYWGPDGNVIERDDPSNPLGERWIGLDDGEGHPTSYGIHGTIDPGSIGRADSAGCVRLRNEDVAEVYDLLGLGSQVIIRR